MIWAWLLEALLIINACLAFYLSFRLRQVSRLIGVLMAVVATVDQQEFQKAMDALRRFPG